MVIPQIQNNKDLDLDQFTSLILKLPYLESLLNGVSHEITFSSVMKPSKPYIAENIGLLSFNPGKEIWVHCQRNKNNNDSLYFP